jgi:16S rRNA (adenine1518-N6/adenine1519-N6)-dimethyltransferase
MSKTVSKRKGARLGQHFLHSPTALARIEKIAALRSDDIVLEIGPGEGALTKTLLGAATEVIAIEKDERLAGLLTETFQKEIIEGKLTVIEQDVLALDAESLRFENRAYKVVANIPYYITGAILRKFLTTPHQPKQMTLLIQKEVAERIARSKKESILSLSVKAYGIPKYEFTVPRGAFRPSPSVDSAVLSIRDISRRNFASEAEENRFFELIHAGFAHKRKYVRSNLADSGLPAGDIPEKARAEDLPLSAWLSLLHI